jgi:cell division protein FtsW (lipid II flippase)
MNPERVARNIVIGASLLLAVGISVVSMTIGPSLGSSGQSMLGFLVRETAYVVVGIVGFAFFFGITQRQLAILTPVIFGGSLFALFAVALFGTEANGSTRWIRFGALTVQPSEIYKFAVCVGLPYALARFSSRYHPIVVWLGSLVGLGFILLQPDLGTSIVVGLISFSMMWTWGLERHHLQRALLLAVVGGLLSLVAQPYQRSRLMNLYFSSFCDPQAACYQVNQARIGMGSGGLVGTGPARARSLWGFLPNAHTDFIISVIGEMFGFIGVTVIIGLFCYLIYFCGQSALQTRDMSSRLIALGATVWLGAEALINIAQAVGIFPVTGIPLPFVSYGGTAMVMNMCLVGLLANIAANQGVRRKGGVAFRSVMKNLLRRA